MASHRLNKEDFPENVRSFVNFTKPTLLNMIHELKIDNNNLKTINNSTSAKISSLRFALGTANNSIDSLKINIEDYKTKLNTVTGQRNSYQSLCDSLNASIKNVAKERDCIKELSEKKDKTIGIYKMIIAILFGLCLLISIAAISLY